eukprot:6203140-Pleurochrysis_carterae.AAC.1
MMSSNRRILHVFRSTEESLFCIIHTRESVNIGARRFVGGECSSGFRVQRVVSASPAGRTEAGQKDTEV